MYLPYPSVIITCTNILLFLEICLFLLIDLMFGDIVFFVVFNFDSLLMLCYAFNLLMAFDRLLLKGLLTYLLTYISLPTYSLSTPITLTINAKCNQFFSISMVPIVQSSILI